MADTASAPGKIMLAGEYAVLDGADAVLACVDRRVHARIQPQVSDTRSPFLAAVREQIAVQLGAEHPAVSRAKRVVADSSALRSGRTKLGLGSSAGVTVASAACALAVGDHAVAPALIHRIAHAAHGQAQERRGARGSGADVAASVYGGVVCVRCREDPREVPLVRPLAPTLTAPLVYLWTGAAARTPALVAAVRAWRDAAPTAYRRNIQAVADAAQAVIAALAPSASPADLVAAIAESGRATAALGRGAGVDLETDVHRTLSRLAAGHAGAAKPTGAGGGDIAVAAFADAAGADAFRAEADREGIAVLPLSITAAGVTTP